MRCHTLAQAVSLNEHMQPWFRLFASLSSARRAAEAGEIHRGLALDVELGGLLPADRSLPQTSPTHSNLSQSGSIAFTLLTKRDEALREIFSFFYRGLGQVEAVANFIEDS